MSSGFGLRGGIGRCYPFFAEYKECLVSIVQKTSQVTTLTNMILMRFLFCTFANKKHEPSRKGELCYPLRDDYFECLHRRKEHGMIRTIQEQEHRNANGDVNDDHGH